MEAYDLNEDPTISDDKVQEVHLRYKESTEAMRHWFVEAEESMRHESGDQWDEEDKALLEELDRPAIVFNREAPFIDAVVGMEINNRKEVRYLPRELGDAQANELLTGAAEWARDESDAEDEESQAFRDMLITGMGWVETSMDYLRDPDGMIVINRRDPFRMRWDTRATKRNISDKEWVMHIEDMTAAEIEQTWPDVDLSGATTKGPWDADLDDLYSRPDKDEAGIDEYQRPDDGQSFETASGKIRVVRYQYVKFVPMMRVASREGISMVDMDQWDTRQQEMLTQGIPYKGVRQKRRMIMQCYVMGNTLLEEGPAPCEDHFSFSAMTGKYDAIRGCFYGMIRSMKDPQKWANAFLSSILETLMAGSKGGIIAERSVSSDPDKLERDWADPSSVVWVEDGSITGGKLIERKPATYPAGLERIMQFAIQSFPDVTGISLEMLGLADREQAGIVETTRKQSGINVMAWAFDSMRRYRKHQGRVLAYLIKEYMADGRLVRITGKTGNKFVSLKSEEIDFKYDVIVDEAPTSANMKERTFQILMELLPALQSMGVPVPPDMLHYTPLPDSMVQDWLKFIEQQSQPDPMAQQAMQVQIDGEAADAEAKRAKAYKDTTEAQQNQLETQIMHATGIKP